MAFDFPNSPVGGQVVTGPNGIQYIWDTVKWIAGAAPNNLAPILSPTFTGDPKAPTPSPGDNDTSLATTAFVSGALAAVVPSQANNGRNFIRNALMQIAQRGSGPFTSWPGYTLDGWIGTVTADALTVSLITLSDADRAAIGDESFGNALQMAFTGTGGATAYTAVYQPIEFARRLANKQITVSWWARATAGTPQMGVSVDQIFGTGGSPSATVQGAGQAVTLSTSWARYSKTFNVPSVSGKTFGSNSNDASLILFWGSSGTNNNTRAGSIGVQSATFQITGVQVELGSTPSVFEKVEYGQDLRLCQRFFQTGTFSTNGYGVAGVGTGEFQSFPTVLRANPIMTTFSVGQTNCTGSIAFSNSQGFAPVGVASANGGMSYSGSFTASAEL